MDASVGHALAVLVERSGRRIERPLAHQAADRGEIEGAHHAAVSHQELRAVEREEDALSSVK